MQFELLRDEPNPVRSEWGDLWRVPWAIIVSLFWLMPKSVVLSLLGREEAHHHDDPPPIDNRPGWRPWINVGDLRIERRYFDAQTELGDFHWHTLEGYYLRGAPPIDGLDRYPFLGHALFPIEGGVLGQAIGVGGRRENCPLVWVDFAKREAREVWELDEAFRWELSTTADGLVLDGESSRRRIRLRITG